MSTGRGGEAGAADAGHAFDAADERFGHLTQEPFGSPVPVDHAALTDHAWRESLFFVMHRPDAPGDVVILTLAHFPGRGEMDSLQLGRVDGAQTFARHARPCTTDPDDWRVGPVEIEVLEPRRRVRLRVAESPASPVALDVTFTARTEPYQLRRGRMRAGDETVWDQRHMLQGGWYDGTYSRAGATRRIERWWGQRDHSWGIRAHARCPMWMWLAIQIPEGMLGVWCWELADGTRIYTDGCLAPASGAAPIPVADFAHDLSWLGADGAAVPYGRCGEAVHGLAGSVAITLADGRRIGVEATGRWAQRYDLGMPAPSDPAALAARLGGGLSEMSVRTSDGQAGTAIYEVTGQWHRRYFPVARGTRLGDRAG